MTEEHAEHDKVAKDADTEPTEVESPETESPDFGREELLDQLKRLQAEFENYRKRNEKERAAWHARALEGFALDLLPVVDSFDRALGDVGEEAESAAALLDGMKLVKKQLLGALLRHGIEPVDALGEPFDPNLHEALMSRPAAEGEVPGTLAEEFLKGYRMGDRIIRATKGIVATESGTTGDEAPEEV